MVMSQENVRLEGTTSPLGQVRDPMHTQEIKVAFPGEGGVIHEVDEESHVDDRSDAEGLRHSILSSSKLQALWIVQTHLDDRFKVLVVKRC